MRDKHAQMVCRQVSVWIRRDTYDEVTMRLFTKENRREFSNLVQSLLENWLSQK